MESRRQFLQAGLAATGAVAFQSWAGTTTAHGNSVRPEAGQASPAWLSESSAASPWVPTRVVDSSRMAWQGGTYGQSGFNSKILFSDPATGSHLTILKIAIGAPGAPVHYHDFHEWAYWLSGDFTNNESTSPSEHMGPLQRYREGVFLDRPAHSLHGGERGREEWMQSQIGGTCLIMEEGDVEKGTHSVEPDQPNYNPDFVRIEHWAVPRVIDTIGLMPWEKDPAIVGLKFKRLVDDPPRGFRANLFWIPAAATGEALGRFGRAYYYAQAHEFNYVISGSLNLQAYSAPGRPAESYAVTKDSLVDRAPRCVLGLVRGVVTPYGCVLLQVTYGKGATVGPNPIEAPIYV